VVSMTVVTPPYRKNCRREIPIAPSLRVCSLSKDARLRGSVTFSGTKNGRDEDSEGVRMSLPWRRATPVVGGWILSYPFGVQGLTEGSHLGELLREGKR